jgi:FtsH-binding integral membrane protein
MSIVSMTNVAFARRTDTAPPVPRDAKMVNEAAHGTEGANDALTTAMGAVIAYFPSEINVLYTAVVAAIASTTSTTMAGQWAAFWFMLVMTPLAVWFVYAARVRAADKPLPIHPKSWPWAEIIVSTVAFAIWAGALPGSPLREIDDYSSTLAGVVVIVGTAVLGWLAAVFQRPIHPAEADPVEVRPN